jgi:NADP-dependent 3-hydroxy acid dehydrogenase YdfG
MAAADVPIGAVFVFAVAGEVGSGQSMQRLAGKTAWITGAGSGIGAATAVALAEEGASVVLTGRTRGKLEAVAARIGAAATVEAADVTRADQVQGIANRIKQRFGRLDILVANAGVNVAARAWAVLAPASVDALIAGNLTSAFYCATAVLPIMRAQQDGLLIFTASVAGRFITPTAGPAYTAAKHGVVALGHSINMEECVNGIRCSVVSPGDVSTPMMDFRLAPPSAEQRTRMAQPEDIADLIRYIACLPKHLVINEAMISPVYGAAGKKT